MAGCEDWSLNGKVKVIMNWQGTGGASIRGMDCNSIQH